MKKNLILYILLGFLIVVNGFFLSSFIRKSTDKKPEKLRGPGEFITKTLAFDEAQLVQFSAISKGHHEKMIRLSDDIMDLKDELFDSLTDVSKNGTLQDSLTTLIGEKVKVKELEVFNHFKQVQEICDDKQKQKFKSIIKDALHGGGERGQRPLPRRTGEDGHRPPPPRRD